MTKKNYFTSEIFMLKSSKMLVHYNTNKELIPAC